MNKHKAKELALVSVLIIHNEIIVGTPFQTFERVYKIAEAFVDKYGIDNVHWGIDLEYEETIISFAEQTILSFATEYAKDRDWKIKAKSKKAKGNSKDKTGLKTLKLVAQELRKTGCSDDEWMGRLLNKVQNTIQSLQRDK